VSFVFNHKSDREFSHSKSIHRDTIKNVYRSTSKVLIVPVTFQRTLKTLDRFSKKNSNMKLHENPSIGVRVILKRFAERHNHDNGGISHFSQGSNKNRHTQTHERHQYTGATVIFVH
jgi:hypothetical protein